MNDIKKKIIYKKTSDYDNITSSTNSNISQTNLDDSVISINDINVPTISSNTKAVYEDNIKMINNINYELTNNLKTNKNFILKKNEDNKIVQYNEHPINNDDEHTKNNNENLDSNLNDNINTSSSLETFNNQNYNEEEQIKQNTLFDKLSNNDINSWIFLGMIIISLIVIIMFLFNNK